MVHVLDRASEELLILAQEVVCAVSWAIEFESLIKAKIDELGKLMIRLIFYLELNCD